MKASKRQARTDAAMLIAEAVASLESAAGFANLAGDEDIAEALHTKADELGKYHEAYEVQRDASHD